MKKILAFLLSFLLLLSAGCKSPSKEESKTGSSEIDMSKIEYRNGHPIVPEDKLTEYFYKEKATEANWRDFVSMSVEEMENENQLRFKVGLKDNCSTNNRGVLLTLYNEKLDLTITLKTFDYMQFNREFRSGFDYWEDQLACHSDDFLIGGKQISQEDLLAYGTDPGNYKLIDSVGYLYRSNVPDFFIYDEETSNGTVKKILLKIKKNDATLYVPVIPDNFNWMEEFCPDLFSPSFTSLFDCLGLTFDEIKDFFGEPTFEGETEMEGNQLIYKVEGSYLLAFTAYNKAAGDIADIISLVRDTSDVDFTIADGCTSLMNAEALTAALTSLGFQCRMDQTGNPYCLYAQSDNGKIEFDWYNGQLNGFDITKSPWCIGLFSKRCMKYYQ